MKAFYSAVFREKEGTVFAEVPDLPGCVTSGKDLSSAMDLIADAASGYLVVAEDEGLPIPSPTPQEALPLAPGNVVSLIRIDTVAYRAATDTRAVRKNVSLPRWMANLADKRGLNCSKILQDSLIREFNARQA